MWNYQKSEQGQLLTQETRIKIMNTGGRSLSSSNGLQRRCVCKSRTGTGNKGLPAREKDGELFPLFKSRQGSFAEEVEMLTLDDGIDGMIPGGGAEGTEDKSSDQRCCSSSQNGGD